MADVVFGGTPFTGGPFESSRQTPVGGNGGHKGGFHHVADLTARDALPAHLREVGMFCYVIATSTAYVLAGGILNANWQAVPTGLSRATYDFINGEESTDLTQTIPQVIGAVYFDANTIIPVSSGRARHVTWESIIETSNVTLAAQLDIYDVTGISTGGTPGVVASSSVSTSNLAPTRFSQSLDAALGTVTVSGMLEARLSIQTPGGAFASCKLARLIVTWD